MQNVDLQSTEYFVSLLHGEDALSFQHVMQMWLRNSGKSGEPAFGSGAAAYALAKLFEEALLQVVKRHCLACGLFLQEIGY